MAEFNVAVLDDYQGVSETHFSKLDPAKFKVAYLSDTLLSYNHPSTPDAIKDALVKRLEPFHIICTMRERTPFPGDLVARLPNLKLLLTTGIRNLALDLPAFEARGIAVAGTTRFKPAVTATTHPVDSTTEHTVTLILGLARNIAADDAEVKAGGWQTSFATSLTGKTLGVVGLGRLGAETARIMRVAFGMRVIAWSANLTQDVADEKATSAGLPIQDHNGKKTFEVVSREEVFSTADVVTVHLVLSDRTRGLINAGDLSRMKPSSLLVNTSRGPLIVQEDLLRTLKEGRISGAALDVFDIEPLPKDSEWRTDRWGKDGTSRVLLTPHMGYVQGDVINLWYGQQVDNIGRWARGESLVNPLV